MADKYGKLEEPKPKAEKKPKKPEAIKHYAILERGYEDEKYTYITDIDSTLRLARIWPKGKDVPDGTYWVFEDVSGPLIKQTKTETVVSVTAASPRKRKASA